VNWRRERVGPGFRWAGLAAIRFQQGKYDEARQLAQQALGADSASPGANVVWGQLRLVEGKPTEAQKSFELATKAEGVPPWILAEAYGGLGRISAFQKIMDLR